MNAMQEMTVLKKQWQAESPPLPDTAVVRERLAADTRAQWRVLGIVTASSLLLLAGTLWRALLSGAPEAWMVFYFSAIFSTLVWCTALWLSRGTWQPRDESLAAHLEVSIRRCRSVIIAAPIGVLLYAAGLIGSLLWKQRLYGIDWRLMLDTPAMIIAGWIGAPLYGGLMFWNAHRQRQRMRTLQDLARQLREG